jgi:hypothetical protein
MAKSEIMLRRYRYGRCQYTMKNGYQCPNGVADGNDVCYKHYESSMERQREYNKIYNNKIKSIRQEKDATSNTIRQEAVDSNISTEVVSEPWICANEDNARNEKKIQIQDEDSEL